MEEVKIRCVLIRGGTSKAVFVRKDDLPPDPAIRDRVILSILGSPDIRQIDGLGGGNSSTSKIAIINPSESAEADVDYTFGQVSLEAPLIDYGGNSGNSIAAVGSYAVDEGLVEPKEPFTTLRVRNTNTGKVIRVTVPVEEGRARTQGDYAVAGVPGTGARISLEFLNPTGAKTGKLLPTGNPKDTVELHGKRITVSVVDAANPVVFVAASELGIKGTELPPELDANSQLMERLEEIRSLFAERIGVVGDRRQATALSPAIPQISLCSSPAPYSTSLGAQVQAAEVDLVCRGLSMQKAHRSYMTTCAVCTAVAANIAGTILNEMVGAGDEILSPVRIGHPYGVMDLEVKAEREGEGLRVESVVLGRTARRIMEGYVYVPADRFTP